MQHHLLILGVWYTMNKVDCLHLIAQPGGRLEGVRVRGGRHRGPDWRRNGARTYRCQPGCSRSAPRRDARTRLAVANRRRGTRCASALYRHAVRTGSAGLRDYRTQGARDSGRRRCDRSSAWPAYLHRHREQWVAVLVLRRRRKLAEGHDAREHRSGGKAVADAGPGAGGRLRRLSGRRLDRTRRDPARARTEVADRRARRRAQRPDRGAAPCPGRSRLRRARAQRHPGRDLAQALGQPLLQSAQRIDARDRRHHCRRSRAARHLQGDDG